MNMQHLVAFRRAILERDNVRIAYTNQDNNGMLQYGRTGFLGEKEIVIRQLRDIFCTDSVNVSKFMAGDHGQQPSVPAVAAIIQSLNGFQMDEQAQLRLIHFLRRLPPIVVKLAPLNRAGFDDFSVYIHLHRLMLLNGKCDMASFVLEEGEPSEQIRRLRVFLACFCLGLIAPLKGAARGTSSYTKNMSALQRIIQRVRGL